MKVYENVKRKGIGEGIICLLSVALCQCTKETIFVKFTRNVAVLFKPPIRIGCRYQNTTENQLQINIGLIVRSNNLQFIRGVLD